jgi:hypothetical protein
MASDERQLELNYWGEDGASRWCWNKGVFASQIFPSEEAALDALHKRTIRFSSADDEDVLGALYATAEVNEDIRPPFDYWCVDGLVVREPFPAGAIVGSFPEFFVPEGKKVLRMTRHEFEVLEAAWEWEQERKP